MTRFIEEVSRERIARSTAARFHVSYFDALILAAARLAGCATVPSEDLQVHQDYGGVRVENPRLA